MMAIWVTICKELRSIFRDRKTLITMLIFPFFIPMMLFLYAYLYDSTDDRNDYIIGVDYDLHQPEVSMMSELHLKGKKYSNQKSMEHAYQRGEIVGYIDYSEKDQKYVLYVNEDSEDGMYVRNYVQSYFDHYQQYLAQLYLIGEDIDVDTVYQQFSYETIDLEGENFMLMLMFTIAFTYIIMSIVLSTTNMATSATAVEKENGTLETLLTFPVRSLDLVWGKYLATVFMGIASSFIGLGLTIGSFMICGKFFSLFREISYQIHFSAVLLGFLIIVLASFFIAGLSMAVTSFARSYKEAQSMSSVLNILTVIPMMISLIGVSIKWWYYLIPIFNYTQILMDVFSGKFDWLSILLVVISSFIYVIVVIVYILKRYRTEKVLFG